MPKITNIVPKYRRHKQSGQAIVTLSGRDYLLGPFKTKSSRCKYNKLVAEWLANDRQPLSTDGLTIGEIVARYWTFASKYYVKGGLPTQEQDCIRMAVRPLLKLYQYEIAGNFGPIALKAVRNEMLAGGTWSRQTINRSIDRIRRMFKWAESEELLPKHENIAARLASVDCLRKGRCEARESKPVKPVDDSKVEATLPFMPAAVASMVRIQRLAGMRPAEVCIMRPCDIDRTEDVWRYVPQAHKTEHHDHDRVVFLGPLAQEILLPYLLREGTDYCFSPVDSEKKRRAEQHAARTTPLSCGNRPGSQKKRKPKRAPRDRYDANTYRRAIHRACDKAFPVPDELCPAKGRFNVAWVASLCPIAKIALAKHYAENRWSPNRLRHSMATEVRRQFGLEHAQVTLGHSAANMTERYAEQDADKAREVALKIG